jgi:hypothetical protein
MRHFDPSRMYSGQPEFAICSPPVPFAPVLLKLTEVLPLVADARAQWQEYLFQDRDFVPFRHGRACRGRRGGQRRGRFARAAEIAHGFD